MPQKGGETAGTEQPGFEKIRQLVSDARASGISTRTVNDIFEEAKKIVRARNGDLRA